MTFAEKVAQEAEQEVSRLVQAGRESRAAMVAEAQRIAAVLQALDVEQGPELAALLSGQLPDEQPPTRVAASPKAKAAPKKKPHTGTDVPSQATLDQIFAVIRDEQPVKATRIAEAIGKGGSTTRNGLRVLIQRKRVAREGISPNITYSVYRRADPVPKASSVAKVRDEVVRHEGEQFGPRDIMGKVRMPMRVAASCLRELARQGIITPAGDEVWTYARPSDAGAAALADARRPKREPLTMRRGGDVVAGAGKKARPRASSPEVRALLKEAQDAGAEVSKASNGHYDVVKDGRRVQVAATPSDHRTTKNDRARMRRELELA